MLCILTWKSWPRVLLLLTQHLDSRTCSPVTQMLPGHWAEFMRPRLILGVTGQARLLLRALGAMPGLGVTLLGPPGTCAFLCFVQDRSPQDPLDLSFRTSTPPSVFCSPLFTTSQVGGAHTAFQPQWASMCCGADMQRGPLSLGGRNKNRSAQGL